MGLLIGVTHSAQAQDPVEDTSPFDNGIKEDLFLTGDDIVIDGPVDGDVIAIGRTVTINGPISGSLIAIGRDIFINDEVLGSAYVSGVKLELGETSKIVRSVYFIGLRLVAESGSMIGRDLTVLSVSAALSGSVDRERMKLMKSWN